MAKASKVPITPSLIAWAIEESGYSMSQLAEASGVQMESLREWARGKSQPQLSELRAVAAALRRPVAAFLLPSPPPNSAPAVEFRRAATGRRAKLNPEERRRLREASRLQRVLGWIARELRQEAPALPRSSVTQSPETVADEVRQRLHAKIEEQVASTSGSMAFHVWREALERDGVVVLLMSMGADSCRGFSIWDETAPTIAVNTSWSVEARLFTLLHEYGHLITRTNSACVETASRSVRTADDVERWCEHFAAAVLLPSVALTQFVERVYQSIGKSTPDLQVAGRIARHFKVSLRAATLRLIELGHADWSLYRALPPSVDRRREGGGGGAGRTRSQLRSDQYGNRVVGLFREALTREVMGAGDVLDYLDMPPAALLAAAD